MHEGLSCIKCFHNADFQPQNRTKANFGLGLENWGCFPDICSPFLRGKLLKAHGASL